MRFKNVRLFEMGVAAAWSAIVLSLAWMATFYRQNWARWIYVIVFVILQTMLYIPLLLYALRPAVIFNAAWYAGWVNPEHYIVPVMFMAAIVCVFSNNANSWFKHTSPA